MAEIRNIELNITREQAAAFIDFLANEGYWGQTDTCFDIAHGTEQVNFIIGGHKLSNVSGLHHHVVIDNVYCDAGHNTKVIVDGKKMDAVDYCLYCLGFTEK